jgi:hypothetical protein
MPADKYKGIYRIPSARWRDWDYGANAAYFVTVCTAHREHFFGEITGGEMQLSAIGQTVESEWLKTPALRPDMNLILDRYVVMPNHFHGIIVIGENLYNINDADAYDSDGDGGGDGNGNGNGNGDGDVQTQCIASLQRQRRQSSGNKFAPQSHNLSSIMRGFKSAVTKFAKMNSIPFAWLSRFNDRVIRDYAEFARIAQYIDSNINNWANDELYDK